MESTLAYDEKYDDWYRGMIESMDADDNGVWIYFVKYRNFNDRYSEWKYSEQLREDVFETEMLPFRITGTRNQCAGSASVVAVHRLRLKSAKWIDSIKSKNGTN